MALLKILYLTDAHLRKLSTPVDVFDNDLQTLIDDMFETMYQAGGVGLAAPQIGVNKRFCVVDISPDKNQRMVFINPEITDSQGTEEFNEGCLSIPGAQAKIIRAQSIKVKALDRHGQSFEIQADGLLGECLQHEIDHLDGKLFIDLLSPLKRQRARKDFEKYLKEQKNK